MISNLMLIDDNAVDQMLYQRIAKKSGVIQNLHQFTLAIDALDFLRRDDREETDAILLDIRMPDIDGFKFLDIATKEFGQNFVRVAVIMLSTSLSERDIERARRYPVVKEYLKKPLTVAHLQSIDEMVNR